jgi:hypothetical protein
MMTFTDAAGRTDAAAGERQRLGVIDCWLRRQLRRQFDALLDDPIPEDMLRLCGRAPSTKPSK